jgi:hypothetical protein
MIDEFDVVRCFVCGRVVVGVMGWRKTAGGRFVCSLCDGEKGEV